MRKITLAAALIAVAPAIPGHGVSFKPAFNVDDDTTGRWLNAKVNASTRGSSGGSATQLYAMDPPLHHHGIQDAIGIRMILQDEEGATPESVVLSFVKYAADGISPDETPAGVIYQGQFSLVGWPAGRSAFDYLFSVGLRQVLPARHGIGIQLMASPNWPADGLSISAQLNLTNDPLRPRVPPPHDQQVWTFERPQGQTTASPLGGRTLDTLLVATAGINDAILRLWNLSTAYSGSGGQAEKLHGPESLHPDAARGDQIGFTTYGSHFGVAAWGLLFVSPNLMASPIPLPGGATNSWIYLDLLAPFPVLLTQGAFDPIFGRWESPAIAFQWFPPGIREFWAQCLILYPPPWQPQITDAVGVKGV